MTAVQAMNHSQKRGLLLFLGIYAGFAATLLAWLLVG